MTLLIEKVKSCRRNNCQSHNTTFKKCLSIAISIIYNIKRKYLRLTYQSIAIPNTKLMKNKEKKDVKNYL